MKRTREQVPGRFSAALPSDIEGFQRSPAKHPPWSYVVDMLCGGDTAMWRRLGDALKPEDASLQRQLKLELASCPEPGPCERAFEVLGESESSLRLKDIAWAALVRCEGAKYAELFEREAPPELVIERAFEAEVEDRPARASLTRLLAAASAVVATTSPSLLRRLAVVLGKQPEADALEATLKLHAAAPSGVARRTIALAFREWKDPRAQAAFETACAAERPDVYCRRDGAATTISAGSSLDDYGVCSDGVDVSALTERLGGHDELLRALKGCDLSSPWGGCFCHLACVDRRAAATVAARAAGKAGAPDFWQDIAALFAQYPEPGALTRKLVELGLIQDADLADRADRCFPELDPDSIMDRAGRIHSFDTETDAFPNAHDSLARELAGLTRGALDDVMFEEIPPALDSNQDYFIRAYADGERFETRARNQGDWYDVPAVVGLLNAVLRARGSDMRLFTLPTGDQTARVLAASEETVTRALQAGVLKLGDADASRASGQEFERRVLERLQQ